MKRGVRDRKVDMQIEGIEEIESDRGWERGK